MGPIEEIKHFLGIKIMQQETHRLLSVPHRSFINKIATKFRIEVSSSSTPLLAEGVFGIYGGL